LSAQGVVLTTNIRHYQQKSSTRLCKGSPLVFSLCELPASVPDMALKGAWPGVNALRCDASGRSFAPVNQVAPA
jgi:hypothetical protein